MKNQNRHWVFRSFLRPSYHMLLDTASLPNEAVIVLHVWNLPSFEDATSRIIYYHHAAHAHRRYLLEAVTPPSVKEIQWDNETSGDEIQATLKSVREAHLDPAELIEMLDRSKSLQVSILDYPLSGGLDGTMYGIEMPGNGFGGYRFMWWGKGPNEWRALIDWYNEVFIASLSLPVRARKTADATACAPRMP